MARQRARAVRGRRWPNREYISIRFDITEAKLNELKLQQTKDRIARAADAAGICPSGRRDKAALS